MKAAIIGCGNVGMAAAYSIFQSGYITDLFLVDINQDKAYGEALDLIHGQSYASKCHVFSTSLENLHTVDIAIITAGVSQKAGETRIDLLNRNNVILKEIIEVLDEKSPDAILLMATNPVDILTYLAQKLSKRAVNKIIGTGTMLDSSRFRTSLGMFFDINPKSIHAYVVGEHGDSEVLLWSQAAFGGQKILSSTINGKKLNKEDISDINDHVTQAAKYIIEKKGYTSWAIGLVINQIVKIIVKDEKTIVPLSTNIQVSHNKSVCIGLPVILGREGIIQNLDFAMNEEETKRFNQSVTKILGIIESL